MLDVLNRYAHGFVIVPVALACRRGGLLTALEQTPLTAPELCGRLGANLGHLQVALRLLESLGWIDVDATGRIAVTPARQQESLIPDALWRLVEMDVDDYLRTGPGGLLEPWLDNVRARWNAGNSLMADFLDGMLVVPVLTGMTRHGLTRERPPDFTGLAAGVRSEVVSLLRILGWLEGSSDRPHLTAPGAFMFDRAMNLGLAESYRPMLRSMDDLLFGDAERCFAPGANGRERHVDRSMNVISSGAQHDRYFAEVDEILIAIFSREPLSAQPRYVADMGSGDGTFLKRVHATVRDKTPRGRSLLEHPLTLIGIDLNEAALEETSRTLGDIDHITLRGDIGDPHQVVEDLRRAGVDPGRVLHIRSFLDHDRPFKQPVDEAAIAARAGGRYLGAYADRRGGTIPAATVVQSLVEHLQRWARIVNAQGLIVLEVHCQDPRVVRTHVDQSESLYFDALQGFSHQLLVEADAALMAAAEAGLFPRPEYFRKFPRHLPYTRITLNLFERQPYRVRLAAIADMPALLRLEEACWPDGMRMPARELERRMAAYALGQWLLEFQGEVVGVIYSQRVAHLDQLRHCTFPQLAGLHDENGGVIQLLALNILPEMQHLGLGYQLLDLILMRSALQGGVSAVAGITRCKDFRGGTLQELAAHVRRTDASGRPIDPILNFHHTHGAELLGLVTDFRPEDIDNLGAGVLLRYDLASPGTLSREEDDPGDRALTACETADVATRLEACLRQMLGPKHQAAFSWTLPLKDMGLDSLDLLGLRTRLQQIFDRPLSPTFFFSHPTLKEMHRFFDRPAAGTAVQSPVIDPVAGDADAGTPPPPAPMPMPARGGQGRENDASRIAIVGMACHFPGGEDLDGYWELLARGGDAVAPVPVQRWDADAYFSAEPDRPGTIVTREGGFLGRVDEFDASFFNISPREARLMDPQQRLLLEMHWESLERAGIDPHGLRDTACGIFVGLSSHDYELLQVETGTEDDLAAYYATGSSAAIAAGRLAYFLGTRGPALTLDTACSSSLVAVHQAIRSLRSGECGLALASGINLMLSPRLSIAYSRAGMLSPNGRCKSFDAEADGYVRAEGCGVVVMKRLEDARRDGDNILAVVRGSGVNQDGASNGLTAPSLTAQEELLRSALRDAGLEPADLDYIEAHGTGTRLGDPIEFHALQAVFGSDTDRTEPLWLGSVKTNIGHTEAAAGIAGLIKVVLSMQRQWLPAHLHFETPNPHIDLTGIPARIPIHGQPWQRSDRPLRAGVNSFGFSGTNAHVIVEQAATAPMTQSQAADRSTHLLALSARSGPALQAMVQRYSRWMAAHPRIDLGDLCRSAGIGRAHHDHRLAVVAQTRDALVRSLGDPARAVGRHVRAESAPKIAFLFTGQGSQYAGMARELSTREPTFRRALGECSRILRTELDRPLEDILYPGASQDPVIDDTAYTQPALFAVEYALARMLQSWGVEPAAVMGHSVGEYVAACIAGVFTLEDGLTLIAARGRLMSALPRDGAMLAVLGRSDAVRQALDEGPGDISVAAYNGPNSIVVSGRRGTIDQLERRLAADGVNSVRLQVSHAFHSPLLEPMLLPFSKIAERIRFSPPKVDLISNVTGERASHEITTADYWCRHIRQPVRFEQGIHSLVRSGAHVMLEIGPHPVLSAMGRKCIDDGSANIRWLHTLARGTSDWEGLSNAVGALYERGVNIAWPEFNAAFSRQRIELPTYPWQRQRYWFGSGATAAPLHGRRIHVPGLSGMAYETVLTPATPAFMDDHRVFDTILVPAPVFMDMVSSAAVAAFRREVHGIREMCVHHAAVVPDDGTCTLHLRLTDAADGASQFTIHSLELDAAGGHVWHLNATGSLRVGARPTNHDRCDFAGLQSRCSGRSSPDQFYAGFEKRGVMFGPRCRAVETIAFGTDEGLAKLRVPGGVHDDLAEPRLHPVLLDAALQTIAAVCLSGASVGTEHDGPALFCGLQALQVYGPATSPLLCHAVRDIPEEGTNAALSGSARLYADDGYLVASIEGARFVTAGRGTGLPASGLNAADLLFDLVWLPYSHSAHGIGRCRSDYLPDLTHLRQHLHHEFPPRPAATDGGNLAAVAAFDALAVKYTLRAFRELGWTALVGAVVSTQHLLHSLGILGTHARLVARMLDMLAEAGIVERHAAGWKVLQPFPPDDLPAFAPNALSRLPAHTVELRLFDRCASRLAEVLTGRCDPLSLLFPEDSPETAGLLYDDSEMARRPNALMKCWVAAVAAAAPPKRVLRILELGAGTGGTTGHLLPLLQTVSHEYVFSDVSKLFLQQAERNYRNFPCVHYALLDIEQPPGAQGFAPGQFDVIIAANVLHATQDLKTTLEHVRTLLAPGGMLALIEGIRPARWIDLVFGQTAGWWRFTDTELRRSHPLLPVDRWTHVLRAAGFAETAAVPAQTDDQPSVFEQAIVMARNPGTADADFSRIITGIAARDPATWLLFGDDSAVCAALTSRLEAGGNTVVRVHPQDPDDAQGVTRAVASALGAARLPCRHAVCLWGASLPVAEGVASAFPETIASCTRALYAAQAVLDDTARTRPKVWFVTRGAHPAGGAIPDPRSAPIWGLGRVLASEHPEVYGGLIDLERGGTADADADAIILQVLTPDGNDQCAIRAGVRFIPRLIPAARAAETDLEWPDEGCYIITGGLGGVGLHVAEWMAGRGARRLVLMSRRSMPVRDEWDRMAPHDPRFEQVSRIREIERLGAVVETMAVDIADEAALARAMTALEARHWLPVLGVFHGATASVDKLMSNLDRDTLRDSFRAKVLGALQLESCLADQPLKFFVYCSSVTSLLSQAGQAGYAAANVFLDAHVVTRRAAGHPALGINWGGWYGAGTAATTGGRRTIQGLEQRGLMGFLPGAGVAALELLLRRNATQGAVMGIDRQAFQDADPAGDVPPMLRRLAATAASTKRAGSATPAFEGRSDPDLRGQIRALAPGSIRDELLAQHLKEILADVLELEAAAIDATQTLGALGLDSLMGIELKNRCERSLGLRLSPTLVWNYPTVADLTRHLLEKLDAETQAMPGSRDLRAWVPAAAAAAVVDTGAGAAFGDIGELTEEAALRALMSTGAG